MAQYNRIIIITTVIMVAILLQVIFVFAEKMKENPNIAVTEFAKAYFMLDRTGMSERLCDEREIVEGVDVIDKHIYLVGRDARMRGFDPDFMRFKLYNIKTHTISRDDTTAEIRITGSKRRFIQPFFIPIAKLFHLGEVHKIDETIDVVLVDNKWKVRGKLFLLPFIDST